MIIQWELNVDSLEEFFNRVKKLEIDNEDTRTQILIDMAEEGLINSVSATNRTKEEIIEDKKRNFGNVLDLTERSNENSSST